jgi:hypothetical protein
MRTDDDIEVQFIVTDQKVIEKIAREPLRVARLDPKPADYRSLGWLVLSRDDAKEESVWLFYPLGHFKRGEKYYITDFTEMRKVVKNAWKSRDMKLFLGDE